LSVIIIIIICFRIERAAKIRNAEKEEDIREAEEIKISAAQHEAVERQKAEQRALDAKTNCADYMRQMEDIKQLKYIEKLQQEVCINTYPVIYNYVYPPYK